MPNIFTQRSTTAVNGQHQLLQLKSLDWNIPVFLAILDDLAGSSKKTTAFSVPDVIHETTLSSHYLEMSRLISVQQTSLLLFLTNLQLVYMDRHFDP